jgi:hypothetical protein
MAGHTAPTAQVNPMLAVSVGSARESDVDRLSEKVKMSPQGPREAWDFRGSRALELPGQLPFDDDTRHFSSCHKLPIAIAMKSLLDGRMPHASPDKPHFTSYATAHALWMASLW